MKPRDKTEGLRAIPFPDLSQPQVDGLTSLRISEAQEEFGGTFAESVEECRTADTVSILGLAFFLGQEPVGLVLLKRPPLAPDWVPRDAVSLHGLKIADRFQGRGLGRRAFGLAIAAIEGRWPDVHQLILAVDAENHAAIQLYRSFGMRDSGPVYKGRIGYEHRLDIPLR